jgi:tRNA threonylcarbamoyl adenosine modification protein YeaZ
VRSDWRLGIDTATPTVALALWSPRLDLVHRRTASLGREAARALVPELDAFLSAHGVTPGDLVAIGVGVGPGSYTGIRIGVAAALGLGRAVGVPVHGSDTLAAIARTGLSDGGQGWATLDARLGFVYAGHYRRQGERVTALEEPRRRPRDELPAGALVLDGVVPDALHIARAAEGPLPPTPRYG